MNLLDSIDPSGDDPDGAPSSSNFSCANHSQTENLDSFVQCQGSAFLEKRLVDHSCLTPVQRTVYSQTVKQLISRVVYVEELFQSGDLARDAAHLGISPEWLDSLRADGPKVVIYEQPQPLPSLYAAIESYGAPVQAFRSLQHLELLRDQLEIALRRKVETGLASFPYLGVSFRGISYGGYLSFPKPNAPEITRFNFFSTKERAFFEHASYSDLYFSKGKIAEFEKVLNGSISSAQAKISSSKKSLRQRSPSNHSGESKISLPYFERGEQFLPQIEAFERRHLASENMKSDIAAAAEACSHLATPDGSIPFIEFIGAFNKQFANRFAPGLDFQNIQMQPIEAFASVGVQNWGRFVESLLTSQIIEKDEAIARYRTVKDGRVRYANVYPERIENDTVIVSVKSDWGLDQRFDIQELATQSAISLREGKAPTLSPISKVRYLLNMAFGSSIILCDGMEFGPISKVAQAMRGSSLLLHPRLPQIHAYAPLCDYKPKDPDDPWAELKETHHALDYYEYVLE